MYVVQLLRAYLQLGLVSTELLQAATVLFTVCSPGAVALAGVCCGRGSLKV
jgi:hypothetical protein